MLKIPHTIIIICILLVIGNNLYCQSPTTMSIEPVNNEGHDHLKISVLPNTFTLVITSNSSESITLSENGLFPFSADH